MTGFATTDDRHRADTPLDLPAQRVARPSPSSSARRLSAPMAALLVDGDRAGRYASRSEVAAALALAAVNARWTFVAYRAAMLDPANAGGAWARERVRRGVTRPRQPYDVASRLSKTWTAAQARAAARPAVSDRYAVVAELAEVRAVADAMPELWGGQAGSTDRLVLDALLDVATDALTITPTASTRQLAERANVGTGTAARSLHRLAERTPFLVREQAHAGTAAPRYRLRRPDFPASGPGGALALTPRAQTPSAPPGHASHDAFAYAGLGRAAARVYGLLGDHGTSSRDLAAALGLSVRTVRRHLLALQAVGLARWNGLNGTWSGDVADLDELAAQLGTAGTGQARRDRHAKARDGYRKYLRIFTRRRGWSAERGLFDPAQLDLDDVLDEVLNPRTGELLTAA